jgi:hypothetical protein
MFFRGMERSNMIHRSRLVPMNRTLEPRLYRGVDYNPKTYSTRSALMGMPWPGQSSTSATQNKGN